MPILQVRDISFIRNGRPILQSITFSMEEGEHRVILGKNGSGKTTLIKILFGHLWPSSGKVEVFGKTFGTFPLRDIQKRIGILESTRQEERLQRNLSPRDILRSGLLGSIGIYENLDKEQEILVDRYIKENTWIKEADGLYLNLSAGEKRKLLLLRSLISEPELLILDEPTSSLDISAREDFFLLLEKYRQKKQFSSVLITHRTEEIPHFYSHALFLKEGKMVFSGTIEEAMKPQYLEAVYDLSLEVQKSYGRFYTHVKTSIFP
ncbi:MAG: ATP-binding cassette domain-containing protein [Leptospiraceae bacterium]|nr:ATP-binding cassette domain-containing protein [Leptospiraceae bacterium]MCP5498998.1 ATP-binding cassette domain-containing protein [Leptospiraceae bacterium]